MENKIQVAIDHLKVGNIHQPHINLAIEVLEKQIPIKPKLMQFAEPEYMCECGYKFYTYTWKPNYCSCCGKKFNWVDYAFKED
jgi:hypothetical protein